MRFHLVVSSQAVVRFTMMSLGGWIRLLEAFKEPAAVFKVKFLTGQKLEKTYSLTRFCLLLTGWHQIRIFTTGKPFWLKLLTFKPPRFGFLLFTQFRQCFTKTPSISCDIVLYLKIQSRVPSRHWSLLGCTYPHPLISWATSALFLVDRPDPWVFWFGNHLSESSLLLVMLGIQCIYCIFTLTSGIRIWFRLSHSSLKF